MPAKWIATSGERCRAGSGWVGRFVDVVLPTIQIEPSGPMVLPLVTEVDPIVWTKNSRSLAITAEVVLSVGLPLS